MPNRLWFVPLVALVSAALACNSGLPAGTVLFKDDFADADGGWKYTDNNTVKDGRLFVENNEKSTIVRTVIDEPGLAGVHLEVSGQNTGGAADEVFGLVCNFSKSDDKANYYFLGIGTDGYYTIGKYVNGEMTTLAEDTGGDFADPAATYRLAADCSRGVQTLYVDGKKIVATDDPALSSGDVGLFLGTYKETGAAAAFDDFVVTQLK
jgi:hypothetical protein